MDTTNSLQTKGISTLSTWLASTYSRNKLAYLNVSNCEIEHKGFAALMNALEKNETSMALVSINVSRNKLNTKGSAALAQLFTKAPGLSVQDLDLSFSNPDFQLITRCENLTNLNVSGNSKIIAKYCPELVRLLQQAPKLKYLSLANCKLNSEITTKIFSAYRIQLPS